MTGNGETEEERLIEWAWGILADFRAVAEALGPDEGDLDNAVDAAKAWDQGYQKWSRRHDQ